MEKFLWLKIVIGIFFIHLAEDILVVTFARFAPISDFILFSITIVPSIVMATYSYCAAKNNFNLEYSIRAKIKSQVEKNK